jgi:hypothetical protein
MLFRSCLVGVVLAGGTSAVIAFRQFSLADIWRDHVSSWAQLHRPTLTMRGEQAIPRLIVQSSRGPAGEPIPLGLTIHGPAEGAVIIITGMLPGMEVTNGIKVDVDRWELPATDVRYASIAPPDGFVGSAAPTAELRLTDDSIADRQAIHWEWVPSSPPGFAENQYNREEAAGPTPPVLAGEGDLRRLDSAAPAGQTEPTRGSTPATSERAEPTPALGPVQSQPVPETAESFAAPLRPAPSPAAAPLAGRRKRGRNGPTAPTLSDVGTSGQKPFFQAGSNKAQSPPCLASAAEVRKLTPNAWPKWTYGPTGERCWYSGEKPVFVGKR